MQQTNPKTMKIKLTASLAILVPIIFACAGNPANQNTATSKPSLGPPITVTSPTPVPTTSTPKNGDYGAKGVVTKINPETGSVEMDHEEIKGVMPAMRMEFYVSDRKMLDGLKVGEKVDFVLRYKDHTETIVNIKNAQ